MKRKYIASIYITVLAVHILLVLFYGMQKEGFHEDEYYSFYTSAGNSNINPYGPITEKSGYDVQRQFLVTEEHRFDYNAVVYAQELDVHPPLYYLTLNTLMSFFPNRFYKWFGIGLNALYSLVSCCGVMFLILNLDKSRYRYLLAGAAGIAYAISPAMISNVMFIRMYTMSAMWTVIYANLFVLLMRSQGCSVKKYIVLTVAGGAVCFLSFLTHYFGLLMPFFLTLGYCMNCVLKRKNILRMFLYGIAALASIGLAVLAFPASMDHIFRGYRGEAALQGLAGTDIFERLQYFLSVIDRNFFAGLMLPVFLLLGMALVVSLILMRKWEKGKEDKTFMGISIYILASGFLSTYLLTRASLMVGDASSRFFYPIGAVMIPMTVYCICKSVILLGKNLFSEQKCLLAGIAAAVIVLTPNIAGIIQGRILFLYSEKRENVEYSQENSQHPVVVVYGSSAREKAWYSANELWPFDHVIYVDYMDGNYTLDNETLKNADKVIVYMDCPETILEDMIKQNGKLDSYSLIRHDPFHYVYEVE